LATPAPEPRRKLWSRPPLLWFRLGYLTLLNVVFSSAYRFVWLELSTACYYTHPLSQIIDCGPTEQELARRLALEPGRRLLSVFRAGRSAPPPASHRLVGLLAATAE